MHEDYSVLIVEDDFRIANIHRQFVEKVDGFVVSDTVRTGEEALAFLRECSELPDLVVLDIYIPDVEGLNLFWEIRSTYLEIDIVVITAAKEVETIQEAIRGGVFDYIIKPVDVSRFELTLTRYKERKYLLSSVEEMEQGDVDAMIWSNPAPIPAKQNSGLPKGIDAITLKEITSLLKTEHSGGVTAVELSQQIGTSRSTARRYLEYLVSENEVETRLKYGTVGRPERRYFRCETYEQND
ncbi:response regulator [Oceanobacillus polygoni]|uniref:Response regulator of citrate/malate metabolism n=1 Tax=Oceanobacillus polygoni TaxID=1235259 RepID=A0A9X0YPM0_9BACI|nr:response regulator [Oceanobacillus polygoni]MBP2076778.1 response regulator of citrate/malate metabolism [Oceanobacillus polygoni]